MIGSILDSLTSHKKPLQRTTNGLHQNLGFALATIFLLSAFNVDGRAKKKIYKGYVITTQGDTIHGKIQMLNPALNEVKVKFIHSDGSKRIYRAKELIAYAFKVPGVETKKRQIPAEWIFYTKKSVEQPPVPFGPTEVLLQQPVKGMVNYYNHYIETRYRQDKYEHVIYVEKGATLVRVEKHNYKRVIKKFLMDYPLLQAKVGKSGYGFKHIPKILKEYNAYIAGRKTATSSF